MKEFNDYDLLYPNLIMDILAYFKLGSDINKRSVLDFCEVTSIKDDKGKQILYQPPIVDKICRILCDKNEMSRLRKDNGLGLESNYCFIIQDESSWNANKERLRVYYNSLVYGFEYIYNLYKDIVVPLVWEKKNGDYSAGTGFKLFGGIVTAKHCITDPKNLSIKGFSAEELSNSKVYISTNENIDIAFIDVGKNNEPKVFTDEGKILQDVLALGYPKIPAFTDFLTAEKATISSKAISRLTPTKGAITAIGTNYFARTELLLITAKIRGGNSGGPVINNEGSIVGVSCQLPNYDKDTGDYDDLGYGIVVPIKYLYEIVESKANVLDISSDFFRDFI